MATVPHLPTPSNPTFYAAYLDLDGLAQRVSGGWLFHQDGTQTVITVDVHNPDLMLYGRFDLADSQRQADAQAGGFAELVCNPDWRLRREL